MCRRWSVFWLWCALWATLGHDLLPSLHQHAHLRSAVHAVALAEPPGATDSDEAPRPPLPNGTAGADDCALCVHLAGSCAALPSQATYPSADALGSLSGRVSDGAQRPPPRVPWLLAVSRAPPGFSTST